MFFIAGMSPKLYQIGNVMGECPACGAQDKLFLVKRSQTLSLFFIPVVKYGGEYLVTCGQCASLMELNPQMGKRVERDLNTRISPYDMQIIKNKNMPRCPQCGRQVYRDQNYCPGCGHKLER